MLCLVAHAIGHMMIVGAYNTVNVRCMWEVTSSSLVWQTLVPAILLMPRGMQGVLLCSSGMGVCGHPQHYRANVGAHNTAWVLRCLEGCRELF